MTKYKEYVKRMFEAEKELFSNFRIIHDQYALNPSLYQNQFNKEGERVLQVIRHWENKLCMQSEKAGFGSYTTSLSEKFHLEVKKTFSEIDSIGLIIKNNTSLPTPFFLKKINLD